eukprot:scaffold108749_cov105-Phaeocystis_antarctica.AAC.3
MATGGRDRRPAPSTGFLPPREVAPVGEKSWGESADYATVAVAVASGTGTVVSSTAPPHPPNELLIVS